MKLSKFDKSAEVAAANDEGMQYDDNRYGNEEFYEGRSSRSEIVVDV
jgi:hypothetical protein